jgi:hypothetical protein
MQKDSTQPATTTPVPTLSARRARKYKFAVHKAYGADSSEATCAELVNRILMRGKYSVDESAQALTQLLDIITKARGSEQPYMSLIAMTQAMLYMQGWELMVRMMSGKVNQEERGQ